MLTTPLHAWICASSFSSEAVFAVRTFRRCVPSPVIAWHSRMSSSAVRMLDELVIMTGGVHGHEDERGDVLAQELRVHRGVIPGDVAQLLELPQPVAHGRQREPDALGEVVPARPAALLQDVDDGQVDVVKHGSATSWCLKK